MKLTDFTPGMQVQYIGPAEPSDLQRANIGRAATVKRVIKSRKEIEIVWDDKRENELNQNYRANPECLAERCPTCDQAKNALTPCSNPFHMKATA